MSDAEKQLDATSFKEKILSFLKDGVWYDGTVKPPPFLMNEFHKSHDHYVAWKTDGILMPGIARGARKNIEHHGGIDAACFMFASEGAVGSEFALGDYEFPLNEARTVALIREYGMWPSHHLGADILVYCVDWMPKGYALMLATLPLWLAAALPRRGVALYLDAASYKEPVTEEAG